MWGKGVAGGRGERKKRRSGEGRNRKRKRRGSKKERKEKRKGEKEAEDKLVIPVFVCFDLFCFLMCHSL